MEAVHHDKPGSATRQFDKFFESAKVNIGGSGLQCRPYISQLRTLDPVGSALTNVTIKSLHQFRWKATPYVVEISINRRWPNLRDMMASKKPNEDFGIKVYDRRWEKEGQFTAWGDDFEILFSGVGLAAGGEDRVRRFAEVVRDIEEALEKA